MIAVPTAIAAILGGLTIYGDIQNAAASGRVQHLARLNASVVKLTQALEDERDLSAGYAASRGPAGAGILTELKTAQTTTSNDVTAVESEANGVTVGAGYQASTVANLTTLLNSLQDLPADRQDVTSTQFPPAEIIRVYTGNIIAAANTFSASVGAGANDAELQGQVTTLGALLLVENETSVQRAILFAALSSPGKALQSEDLNNLNQAYEQESADLDNFNASTSEAEQENYTNTVSGSPVDEAASEETLAQSSIPGTPLTQHGLTATTWFGNMTATIGDTRAVANELVSNVSARANSLNSRATRTLLIISLVTLVLLLLILLVSTIVARSLIRPLRKLRSDALDVAGHRLPEMVRRLSHSEGTDEGVDIEPIGVTSTDEIGEVARAFDQVHREAVRLAADEAMLRGNLNAMFINLSRRSQSLIERQLSLIDSLEQSEQDPGRLSSLFRLDHLATRMRRNSENLLVLAGHEVTRRWSQPVPLVDVLRAAISEIEQYERVVLNVQPGIVVVGQAVNDVVHLVAEIVENATTFSPEDTQVYVSGQPLSSGGVLLDITDNGVGISDQEMSHANWRLDNPPVVDVAVSRRMGLFVVGRLAARHGVRVRLRHAQAGGLTALIWLPDTVAAPEVAPPLGRLRRFEAEDYGPAPSLSAPTQAPTIGAVPTTQAARIPRFSPMSPSAPTPPSFAPPTHAAPPSPAVPAAGDAIGNLAAAASRGWDESREEPTQALPARNGAASGATPANGSAAGDGADATTQRPPVPTAANAPSAPSRLPSFGGPGPQSPQSPQLPQSPIGGQNVHGGDGPSVSDAAAAAPNGSQTTDDAGGELGKVQVPPPAAQDQRLPIFDSLESDWFRRSGKTLSSTRVQSTQQAPQASWTSPADEGWRAAQALAAPAAGETTQAGLPRRVPRANLVPGSIGSGGPEAEAEAPARSPDAARNRMASFQRGVREGRAATPQIEEPTDR
jgi:signal transduction histidine kinase